MKGMCFSLHLQVKKLDIPIKFRCLVSRVISNNQNDVLVRDIFMELIKDPHATVGLAGPKGTGKSTTLLLYAYYLNLCNCPLLYCGHDEIVLWSGKGMSFPYNLCSIHNTVRCTCR